MSEFILKPQALSHPLANGQYDKENTNEDFIAGYESYREWLEALPALSIETLHGIMRSICKHNKIDVGINGELISTCTFNNRATNEVHPWVWCDLNCPFINSMSQILMAKEQEQAEMAQAAEEENTNG